VVRNTRGDLTAALEILDALYSIAKRTHNKLYEMKILAVRALALKVLGKSGESEAALMHAVELSKPGGVLRVFADLGESMREMLGELAERNHSGDTIQKILAAFPGQGIVTISGTGEPGSNDQGANGSKALTESLSPREIQVLSYLREPLGIKDIARKLEIRYATAKRHTINIYGKLGVNSRWDAVDKAVELGILPAS
jgi:LuxR family maltose regulon positive regulatory protein